MNPYHPSLLPRFLSRRIYRRVLGRLLVGEFVDGWEWRYLGGGVEMPLLVEEVGMGGLECCGKYRCLFACGEGSW